MTLLKYYVNSRVEHEYYVALEQPNRRKDSETGVLKGLLLRVFEITYQL